MVGGLEFLIKPSFGITFDAKQLLANSERYDPRLKASAALNWTVAQAGEFWTGFVKGTDELLQGLGSTVELVGQCVKRQAACGETLGAIATTITTDPGKFFGSLIDWEDLSHGRIARWLGHLAPSIASLVVTKGAANAISKVGLVTKFGEAFSGTGRAVTALAKTGITRAATTLGRGAEAAIAKGGGALVDVTRSAGRSLIGKVPAAEGLSPELTAAAESHITNTGVTVLGKFEESGGYIAKAQGRGASYFDIGDAWNAESGPVANQHFLDTIASRGDQVLLSIPKTQIQVGTSLEGEIQVLTQNWGYRWVNQWALRPGA